MARSVYCAHARKGAIHRLAYIVTTRIELVSSSPKSSDVSVLYNVICPQIIIAHATAESQPKGNESHNGSWRKVKNLVRKGDLHEA